MVTAIQIRDEVLKHLSTIARGQDPTLTYGDLAAKLGVNNDLRRSKARLDSIAQWCAAATPPLPDITVIIKAKKTGYPSQINGRYVGKRSLLTANDKAIARARLGDVIGKFCPGAINPY
ncbi:MAG: hypothetical protein ACREHE_08730 [Rhizomicrobium sp.]